MAAWALMSTSAFAQVADGEYYLSQVKPGDTLIDAQARLMEENRQ